MRFSDVMKTFFFDLMSIYFKMTVTATTFVLMMMMMMMMFSSILSGLW